jgi:TP901 family phage tail tape measure protein
VADRTIRVRLQAEVASYLAGLKTAATATSEFGRNIAGLGTASHADMEKVGRAALLMGGAVALGLGAAAKAAIDWESSWAGVTKTVEGTVDEMAALEDSLRNMATELPATHSEIAAVAEAAGALGVATPAVESFTRTMIDLGETTDLTADQAANAFARIANIMGTPQTEFDRMGSTVVELGNSLAATESEITEMALRIAGAGEQIGLSESEVLGFAGALASVGIEAEAGGSAISRVFISMDQAVREGGDELASFAEVAGMTAEQFATAYRDDAGGAVVTFIEGLDRISASGGNVFGVLADLELNEIRVRDALLRAAGAGELFGESLDIGARAWEENIALSEEAEKRYATTVAQFEMLRNQIVDLGIDIGAGLLPIVKGAAEGVAQLVAGFQAMPGPMQTATTIAAGLAAALLGAIGIVGTLAPKVIAARNALLTMGTAAQFLGRNLTLMLGIAGAVVVAVSAVAYAMGESASRARAAEERINGMAQAMREAGSAGGGFKTWLDGFLQDAPELTSLFADAEVSIDDIGAAMSGTDAEFAAFRDRMLGVAEDSGYSGVALRGVEQALDGMRGEAGEAVILAGDLNTVLGETESAGAAAEGGIADVGGAAQDAADDFEELKDAIDDYKDALRSSVDPLFALTSAQRRHAQNQVGVGRAQQALTDAQEDLNAVLSDPEATDRDRERAQRALEDAFIAVGDAHYAVADSALDLQQSEADLAESIALGTTTADEAREAMQRLADEGILTQQQVDAFVAPFDAAIERVRTLQSYSDIDLLITANADQAIAELEHVVQMIDSVYGAVPRYVPGDFIGPLVPGQSRLPGYNQFPGGQNPMPKVGNAGGGWAGTNTWGPTDTINTSVSPGEFILSARGASAFTDAELYGMNQGLRPAGGGWGGGGSSSSSSDINISGNTFIAATHAEAMRAAAKEANREKHLQNAGGW